jgi:hypothetical protein
MDKKLQAWIFIEIKIRYHITQKPGLGNCEQRELRSWYIHYLAR